MKPGKIGPVLRVFLATIVTTISLVGCGPRKVESGHVVVEFPNVPGNIVPGVRISDHGRQISDLIFDGLTSREFDDRENRFAFVPSLAASIEQSRSYRNEYRIELKDVLWHDGRKLEARDVVFSWRVHTDPDNESLTGDLLSEFIADVRAIDADSVLIAFREPIPRFRALSVLSFKVFPFRLGADEIDPRLRQSDTGRAFLRSPVGTGPFRFAEYEPQGLLHLVANDDYFKGAPEIRSITIRPQPDVVLRIKSFRRGRTNMLFGLMPTEFQSVDEIEYVRFAEYTPFSFVGLVMSGSGVLGDRELRRSVLSNLDHNALIADWDPRGFVINYGALPTIAYERGGLVDYGVDPPSAVQMQPEASVRTSDSVVRMIYSDELGQFGEALSARLSGQLESIGFDVETRRLAPATFEVLLTDDNAYDFAVVNFGGFDNLFTQLYEVFGSDGDSNYSGISSNTLDQSLRVWSDAPTIQERIPALTTIEHETTRLAPMAPLFTVVDRVYYTRLDNVYVDSGSPFASAEQWIVQ